MKDLSLARVRQQFLRTRIDDVPAEIYAQMQRVAASVRPGMSVAITAGSRGIRNIPLILGTVVKFLRDRGAQPFLFAAMGSHGGGTPEGQASILHHLGITEETVGAPLRVTSKAVDRGVSPSGHTLYTDAEAVRADGIFMVNRIKPHTAFRAEIASGLFKMLTVGMGKVPGAAQVHKLGSSGMYPAIIEMSRLLLQKLPVMGGLAIVENSFDETARIECLLPAEMEAGERRLLELAAGFLPRLPVQELDLLIVEEMGKNFSGTGMDTNVIGRWKDLGIAEPLYPLIKRIVVLRLSKASEGNANGIGLVDFTTRKLVASIDWNATLTNVRATGFWNRAFCPPFPGSDSDAIEWAVESLKLSNGVPVKAARIRNTLHLEELWLSREAFDEATGCEQTGPFKPLTFNQEGDLMPED